MPSGDRSGVAATANGRMRGQHLSATERSNRVARSVFAADRWLFSATLSAKL